MITKEQLIDLLTQPDFAEHMLSLNKSDVEAMLGLECSRMVGFEQRNPHHCYTLFEHCVRTAENITVKDDMDTLLKTAALFHDIGKPYVAREKEGRLVFYGHAEKSYRIMKNLLSGFGFNNEECYFILFLIRHHDDFISYTDEENKAARGGRILISEANLDKHLTKLKNKYKGISDNTLNLLVTNLLRLCRADAEAQSEYVYINGVLKDSRADKLRRISGIEETLSSCLLKQKKNLS